MAMSEVQESGERWEQVVGRELLRNHVRCRRSGGYLSTEPARSLIADTADVKKDLRLEPDIQ
jgi:hypothetical protein